MQKRQQEFLGLRKSTSSLVQSVEIVSAVATSLFLKILTQCGPEKVIFVPFLMKNEIFLKLLSKNFNQAIQQRSSTCNEKNNTLSLEF